MTLVQFKNNRNLVNPWLNDVLGSVFNDSFISDSSPAKAIPAVNIAETDNGFDIELAAPGLKKEDFKINLEKNVLTVSAEKKSEETEGGKKYSRKEFIYSTFSRSFTLPNTTDHTSIAAEYSNGVLNIQIAKKEEAKPVTREIEIK